MLTLAYKLDGTSVQYAAIDEGIRVMQFLRNKCLRAWVDHADEGQSKYDMTAYTAVLAKEFDFAGKLGSQARQASAERAWKAIDRFYANCNEKKPGKKGYPRFKKDTRSIEYKVAGVATGTGRQAHHLFRWVRDWTLAADWHPHC